MFGIAAIINTNNAPLDDSILRGLMTNCEGVRPLHRVAQIKVLGAVGLGGVSLPHRANSEGPACLDGGLWAVMSGRLDDRKGLSASLDLHPSDDADSLSDVALVLRAYDKWGDDCVSHLLGDFAFCLWDARRRRLLCARDHFGVKPLYYARVGSVLIVSSVLDWVRRHSAISQKLRDEAVGDFLLFGVNEEPSHTTFADISRVPPAHQLSFELATDSTRTTRYWSLETRELVRYADPGDYVDQFSQLLRVAVEDRVRDAPVGVLMSGGLDSSSVATVAAEVLGTSARDRLRAFTFVYETWLSDGERHFASAVATSLGIEASRMAVDSYEPFERWDGDSCPAEPTLEGLTAVMSDALDLMSRHGGVALTGDGGDPMMLPSSVVDQVGSMPIGALAADVWHACRTWQRPPSGIRSWIERRLTREETIPGWLGRDLLAVFDASARSRELQARRATFHGARHRAISDAIDPWWPAMFEGLDPGATRRPVELRYPFFDVRVASFILRLPSFPWCLGKRVLRTAMKGRLPEAVRTRPKTPLAASPVAAQAQWSAARALSLLESTPAIERFVDIHRFRSSVSGDSLVAGDSYGAWAAISLAMWLRCDAASTAPVAAM